MSESFFDFSKKETKTLATFNASITNPFETEIVFTDEFFSKYNPKDDTWKQFIKHKKTINAVFISCEKMAENNDFLAELRKLLLQRNIEILRVYDDTLSSWIIISILWILLEVVDVFKERCKLTCLVLDNNNSRPESSSLLHVTNGMYNTLMGKLLKLPSFSQCKTIFCGKREKPYVPITYLSKKSDLRYISLKSFVSQSVIGFSNLPQNLEFLEISNCGLYPQDTIYLCDFIQKTTTLRHFHFREVYHIFLADTNFKERGMINKEVALKFQTAFNNNKSIMCLNLSPEFFNFDDCFEIIKSTLSNNVVFIDVPRISCDIETYIDFCLELLETKKDMISLSIRYHEMTVPFYRYMGYQKDLLQESLNSHGKITRLFSNALYGTISDYFNGQLDNIFSRNCENNARRDITLYDLLLREIGNIDSSAPFLEDHVSKKIKI